MEYAPGCTLPVVSIVDAGTVELVRAIGVEVVSSADVLQQCVAVWSPRALEVHRKASATVAAIKDEAFAFIKASVQGGKGITERDAQQLILRRFREEGLEVGEAPIVAVNAHAGDPHFEVSATDPAPIRAGDWVLIDLWSRYPGEENIYSDITWVGFCGSSVPTRHQQVFEVVRAARDASVSLAKQRWKSKQPVQGWELDEAARGVIIEAGFERAIKHRTGHSLSPGPRVHGLGVNLDNLETHDTREVLPGLGYTVEPGIYLPEFGVRLEINVFTDPHDGPVVTSCIQDQIVCCG
jgi:Xaa-Pro dipeptidase